MGTCMHEQISTECEAQQTATGTSGDVMEMNMAQMLAESQIARKKASKVKEVKTSEKNNDRDVVHAEQDEEEDKEARTGVEGGEGRKDVEMSKDSADGEAMDMKSIDQDINEKIKELIMMYVWVDLVDPDLTFVFGDMNSRMVNLVEVTKLIGSFLANQVR